MPTIILSAPTRVHYLGDGVATAFAYSFPTLSTQHVRVTDVDGNALAVQFISPNSVVLAVAPAAGFEVRIFRDTSLATPLVTFGTERAPSAEALTRAHQQAILLCQELRDLIDLTRTP